MPILLKTPRFLPPGQFVTHVKPGDMFLKERMLAGFERGGVIKCVEVEVYFIRTVSGFVGDWSTTLRTETPLDPW